VQQLGELTVRIRLATANDAPALERLIGQLGYEENAGDIAQRLAAMEGAVLVAEMEGRVAGCLSTSTMQVLHRPKPVGRISMMVVEEGLRGQGIGAALVHAAEDWLKQQGCGLVEVTSNLKRTEAHGFYEKLGYERTSLRFAIDPAGRE
jgi:GNAT superfamily N-acetyltransferase